MRLIAALACAATLISAAEIPNGAHVLLRMQNTINTRTAKVGDYVYLRTDTPISANNSVVVPIGSHVQGIVAMVNRAGKVKGRAELAIRLEILTLPSGKQLKFEPRIDSLEGDAGGQAVVNRENTIKQGGTVGKDTQQVAIMAGSGAMLGAIIGRVGNSGGLRSAGIGAGAGTAVGLATALLTRGKDVELRQGTTMDVVFDRPIDLQ